MPDGNGRMISLNDIYKKYCTPEGHGDKGTAHSYIEAYDGMFTPYRTTANAVLEIGVARGHSIQLWEEYFSKAKIY